MIRPPQIGNRKEEDGYGAIRAFDPQTGERKWEYKMTDVTDSGILTTASDLLFIGGREGYFMAMNARDGELLWKAVVGGQVSCGADELLGKWQAVCRDLSGKFAIRIWTKAVN